MSLSLLSRAERLASSSRFGRRDCIQCMFVGFGWKIPKRDLCRDAVELRDGASGAICLPLA